MMKKATYTLICLLLVVTFAFSGCSPQAPEEDQPAVEDKGSEAAATEAPEAADDSIVTAAGELPIVKEEVTLKVLMPRQSTIEDYETNKLTVFMEEKTGVKLDMELVPGADAKQKVNLILATQTDMPDMFIGSMGLNGETLTTHGEQGTFVKLNDYIEKYGYYFDNVKEDFPNIMQDIAAYDGSIYTMPRLIGPKVNAPSKYWINTTFLENVGMEMPTTTDEFYEVLKAFKEQDANGNGDPNDEVPLIGATNGFRAQVEPFLMNSFLSYSNTKLFLSEEDTVEAAYVQDEYREALRYMNKLCEEGLLDPVSFTQNKDQLRQLSDQKEEATVGVLPSNNLQIGMDPNSAKTSQYQIMMPLEGPEGIQYAETVPPVPGLGWVAITSECEYPEVAFRWLDYLYSEEATIASALGEEGVDWVKPEEGVLTIAGEQATRETKIKWGELQNTYWFLNHPAYVPKDLWVLGEPGTDPESIQSRMTVAEAALREYGAPKMYNFFSLSYTADETTQMADIKSEIDEYVKESMARFTMGDLDVDADWDEYIANLEKMGIEDYLEIVDAAYQRKIAQ